MNLIPSDFDFSAEREFFDKHQNHLHEIASQLHSQLDEAVKEGLRRKGYTFKSDDELKDFAERYITIEDYLDKKLKVYYVKGEPFFQENYKVNFEGPYTEDRSVIMRATTGGYSFL